MYNGDISKLSLSKTYSESLVLQALSTASSLSTQAKVTAHKISIEIKEIKPRETQALMDEIEARISEGSLF
jgi:hypothetical protein